MTEFAETFEPHIASIADESIREDVAEALRFIHGFPTEVVSEEKANKGLPKMRKQALNGTLSVIARRGKISALRDAAVLISAEQLVNILARVYESTERQTAERQSPAAILSQLEPTHIGDSPKRIGLRRTEESVGGRPRLR